MSIYDQIGKNKFRTYLIIILFIIIVSGFFYFLGNFFSTSPMTYFFIGFTFSMLSSIGSYFYSDKIVLFTTHAHPASKEDYFDFYTVTENLTIADGLPMPKLYVIDDEAPNAFATGRNYKHAVVCATTGLLDKLDRTELEGVISHELSHVKNYDILLSTIVAVLVGTIALVADLLMRSFWWGGFRRSDEDRESRNPFMLFFMLLLLIIMPIVATLIQLAISRRRELLADASGALLTRYPEGLARALEKISSDHHVMKYASASTAHLFIADPFKKKNISSWFLSLFNTHPPAEERIRILRNM